MRLREVYLSDREALGVTATRIWNLDLNDPIMCLKLRFEGLHQYDAANDAMLIPEHVSKIEVVDGSDVLYSTDLYEALAQHLYSGHQMPWCEEWDCGLAVSVCNCAIWFSRDMSDQQFMLDPKKFVNPQLKITYNFPVGAGKYVDGSQVMSVIAVVCENPVREPEGFLMTKNIYEWLTVIGATETIDMPRDYPYRLILNRCYYPDHHVEAVFTQYKMSCDIDRFVPFNIRGVDLKEQNFGLYPQTYMKSRSMGDGAAEPLNSYHYFGDCNGATEMSNAVNEDVMISGIRARYIEWREAGGGIIDNLHAVMACVFGSQLGFCQPIKFGNLIDPEEWFDPTSYMSVRLIIQQAALSDKLGGIVIQQKRNY